MNSLVSGTRQQRRLPWVGWLAVPLLGLFFLVYPISMLLASNPTPEQIAIALGGTLLFIAGFLWLMWRHEPLELVQAEPSDVWKYRAIIAFLAVVAGILSLVFGAQWRMLFVYHINVAAGIMLPRRDAYVTVALVAFLTVVLGFPVGLSWLAVPAGALGLWAISFVGQVATVAELRAAREALARRAVAEERLRFSRDLHDLLGHSLSLITLKNELAGKLIQSQPERAAREIHDAEEVARRALHEVRQAVTGYRQPTLGEELIRAEEMLTAANIACRIENEAGRLARPLESVLAWAVREGSTNVMRHSRARHCSIRIARDDDTVSVEISDDGRGATTARNAGGDVSGGSGLAGLAERVAEVTGSSFEAGALPRHGFRLAISLPLPESELHQEEYR